jgi:flagellar motor switch protein FliN
MMGYIDCWVSAAKALFAQAIAEGAELTDSSPGHPGTGACGFVARLQGSRTGRFTVILDPAMLSMPLLGDVADQKAAWGELLREVAEAAAGQLYVTTGEKCEVAEFTELTSGTQASRAFQMRSSTGAWTILVQDELRGAANGMIREPGKAGASDEASHPVACSAGVELLLDVELEAALRFGCRELSLSEVLELGPGDVVELDRNVADPVDLIVGDKIVARGEVVLVNGNFGLRVTEVAAPRKRLESIRCLF